MEVPIIQWSRSHVHAFPFLKSTLDLVAIRQYYPSPSPLLPHKFFKDEVEDVAEVCEGHEIEPGDWFTEKLERAAEARVEFDVF